MRYRTASRRGTRLDGGSAEQTNTPCRVADRNTAGKQLGGSASGGAGPAFAAVAAAPEAVLGPQELAPLSPGQGVVDVGEEQLLAGLQGLQGHARGARPKTKPKNT